MRSGSRAHQMFCRLAGAARRALFPIPAGGKMFRTRLDLLITAPDQDAADNVVSRLVDDMGSYLVVNGHWTTAEPGRNTRKCRCIEDNDMTLAETSVVDCPVHGDPGWT